MSCLSYLCICSLIVVNALSLVVAAERPNIVLIYADDVGYGDVACNGQTTLPTPHIDSLARDGLRLTDAHCSAATCTPSRFALLTGQYAFRQKGTGIAAGNANLIIKPSTTTSKCAAVRWLQNGCGWQMASWFRRGPSGLEQGSASGTP